MEIVVLRKMEYKNTFIYIMQFQEVFQYLFVWDKDIYQDHIILKVGWFQKFLYLVGYNKALYTQEQLEDGEKVILNGAIDSIDKLK